MGGTKTIKVLINHSCMCSKKNKNDSVQVLTENFISAQYTKKQDTSGYQVMVLVICLNVDAPIVHLVAALISNYLHQQH